MVIIVLGGVGGLQQPSRVPRYNGTRRNIFRHHAASANRCSFANDHPAQDRGAGANGGPAFDGGGNADPVRFGLETAIGVRRARETIVDERHSMANENLIFKRDTLHRKLWLEILHRFPTRTPFWISTNAPMLTSSPISHP